MPSGPTASRTSRLATWLCFAVPLALYLMTASRTAQGGDTTEFALVGTLGGVAHPPGYPLYTLLARWGAALDWGGAFFRVSAVSAFLGAAAVAVLQRLTWRLTGNVGASVASALAFALCREQWRLSGVPEVFSLHALAAALTALVAVRLAESAPADRARWASLLGVTFGLGLSNHLTLVLLAPVLLWAFAKAFAGETGAAAARLLAFFSGAVLLGLLPYTELIWAARTAGPHAPVWGDTGTWRGLLHHVLRQDYGTFKLGTGGAPHPARHLRAYLQALPMDLGYIWLIAAIAGIGFSWRRRPGWTVALLGAVLLSGVLFISRFNLPDDPTGHETETRFYLLPHLLLFPFVAEAVAAGITRLRRPVALFVAGAALLVPAVMNFHAADWRADTAVERTTIAMVNGLAPNAVLVGRGDLLLSGVGWVTHVLRIRPDVRYIDANLLAADWYFNRVRRECPECGLTYSPRQDAPIEVAARLAARVPAYIPGANQVVPAGLHVHLEPVGLVNRVVPDKIPMITLNEVLRRLTIATSLVGDQPPPVDAWSASTHLVIGQAWRELSRRYERLGRKDISALCEAHADSFLSGL